MDQIVESYKDHPSIIKINEKMDESPELSKFEIPQSTESDIYEIITNLNTKAAQGYDKIHPKI